MGKNVVIFSDGTGQAGGFRFDEKRSNVYKLYRATRCSPDSSIDPQDQVTFYDPGLGSQADGGHLGGRIFRWIYNTVAQATGFGITRNIVDCYAALIQLWRPGDRVFLFGFSRGAYTIRCLGGVISRCGIPRHPEGEPDRPLKIDAGSAHKLAGYAVKQVYQFTYPRKIEQATSYQKFLLETRERLADRFRSEYGSADPADPKKANIYPYFIGVFDTVAALGNPRTTALFLAAFLAAAAVVGAVGELLSQFDRAPAVGRMLGLLSFTHVFWGIVMCAALLAAGAYVYTHLKWDLSVPGYTWKQLLRTIHFNGPWMTFYDQELNPNVKYARHAISIDEDRKNFQLVGWYSARAAGRDQRGIQWFEQVWFAGNHSDVGGSYPENDSRLSDITLDWMVNWAAVVPNGLKQDRSVLQLWPYADGLQHDELKSGFGLATKVFGWTWTEKARELSGPDAVMHRTVYQRFDLPAVQVYDQLMPYRPVTLAKHDDFARFYTRGVGSPATSLKCATAMADEPRAP